MLILSRKQGESIKIGEEIEITVSRISGNRVTIGIAAPGTIHVVRSEIADKPRTTEARDSSTDQGSLR